MAVKGMADDPFEVPLCPMFPGDCGKPKELQMGHPDGSFEGFDLEGIHTLFDVKMPPGKGMPAAKGGSRNDIRGAK